jgi:hypothetical protein
MDIRDVDAILFHPLFPYLLVLGIVSLIGLLTWLAIVSSKKEERIRTAVLKERGLQLGLSYSEPVDIPLAELTPFGGHTDKAWNMLKGERQGFLWRIFDHRTGSGKTMQLQTLYLAETGRRFPEFMLMQETLMSKLCKLAGFYKDIDFDQHPLFSKQYVVGGVDEDSVRALFTPGVIRHFETRPIDGVIAASGNRIAYRQPAKRMKPEDLHSKLDEVAAAFSAFLG